MSGFGNGVPLVPATVAALDPAVVCDVLVRHNCNVTEAAADLGVSASDLRRLLWARPHLQDAAYEQVEARLDAAEKNIVEALNSDDGRVRMAASFFVLRNTGLARRRGWVTSSTGGSVEVNVNAPAARTLTFRWRTEADDLRDAERERQEAEDWAAKTIEGKAG